MDKPTSKHPVDVTNLKHQRERNFESSQIHGYEYHAESRKLYVQFKSNGARVTYAYPDISPELAAEADAAESKGKFFGKSFTGAHPVFDKLPGYAPTED